jgi:hypothetical protein
MEKGIIAVFPSILANQTQVDGFHGTNLEPLFHFDLANQVGRKLVFLLEQFFLQPKILSSTSLHAQRADIIGCVGDI